MSEEYPKSRLPGPAVTLFLEELRLELEAESQASAFAEETRREKLTVRRNLNANVLRRR